ncbi:LPS assembly lipoprotein LptE [Mucilaginibacter sp. RS28]|uniref:LPS assembly lipoprotein LptE n=1 Tax=Mucilaginibacter straminoryzae TaxID=2932774 RepID=A0A9X2BDT6_9SPHI|nr:LptE family protein [Mucilaginibacter straminoryzae]MCJ8210678.1 LPS assembly lipoprotein LptE [Mucilaginibacter straminoryzae]
MLKRGFFGLVMVVVLSCLSQSCAYRLDAASIPPTLKTINVEYFENNAPLVVNNLSQNFTESLKNRIRSQTRLSIVRGEADARLSGNIIGYSIAPVSVQATQGTSTAPPIASASRLSITVNVKYTLTATDPESKKLSFEQQFTRYRDFKGDIQSQLDGLLADINKQLTDDIFNRAFSNW